MNLAQPTGGNYLYPDIEHLSRPQTVKSDLTNSVTRSGLRNLTSGPRRMRSPVSQRLTGDRMGVNDFLRIGPLAGLFGSRRSDRG